MTQPKQIDLSNITPKELENLDDLIKTLVEREKQRQLDPSAHTNDHRSSHTSGQ